LMILLFLGSWRSTLIIAISIPLSILASIIALSALGETINIMTLGGLALAVGILVDDATVTIENINSHLEQGKDVYEAIMEGAHQIAIPALVSTLSICIVFVPIFFLGGVAKYLFAPLAEAVVFAMLASYVLSRTLVPTLSLYWLKKHVHGEQTPKGPLARFQAGFERRFEKTRDSYRGALVAAEEHRGLFAILFFSACALSVALLVPWLGRDFFPYVDGGQIELHFRAQTGLRIEETARLADGIENTIRQIIPKKELVSVVDTLGLPYSGINLSYSNTGVVGTSDGDIFVSLGDGHHPTIDYVRTLRQRLMQRYPGIIFSFLPADIVGQILNFGSPAPIDVQVSGRDAATTAKVANELYGKLLRVPGLVDLRLQQALNLPQINVNVDRTRANLVGLTQQDVAGNLLTALAGSSQVSPTFWVDPKTGVSYTIATQAPQYRLDTLQALKTLPITSETGTASAASTTSNGTSGLPGQTLQDVASFSRSAGPAIVTHYSTRPTMDLYAAVDRTDLGSVAADVQRIVDAYSKHLPRGVEIDVRGQVKTMAESYRGLIGGLAFAIVLVYLLIVVNFQSWVDPLIIIAALPAALAGLVWMLFLTSTPLSVPALMGAIMCMGVATANSILVISFAREQLDQHGDPVKAAIEAGFARFRPVLMTAFAMIIGMVPMALGMGEGGEQNAPLGRAVIGGLLLATAATLFFVPTFFSLLHRRRQARLNAAAA